MEEESYNKRVEEDNWKKVWEEKRNFEKENRERREKYYVMEMLKYK